MSLTKSLEIAGYRMDAAYFLSACEHLGRPFDEAIILGLLEAGCREVHLYAPGPAVSFDAYGKQVQTRPVDYRLTWLRRHILSLKWRDYAVFLGACNLPMAFAGALAMRARRPVITACDEIYTGRRSPAARHWEMLSRLAMRRAACTVITDLARCDLQRRYAGLSRQHVFAHNPCCFVLPYDGRSKADTRQRLNIPENAFVLALTGEPHDYSGAPELISLMGQKIPWLSILVLSAGGQLLTTDRFFTLCASSYPLYYESARISYRQALEVTNGADVGLVIYRQTAPQFQNMGVSSNKLCCHLLLGQPVIALRQPSFSFIEDYRCGILIDREQEIVPALKRLRAEYDVFSRNALHCVREHISPDTRVRDLADQFKRII